MLLIVAKHGLDFCERRFVAEIGGDHFDCATRLRRQSRGQGFQFLAAPRHQNEVVTALREPVGVNSADAGRSAGNKGCAGGMGHPWNS